MRKEITVTGGILIFLVGLGCIVNANAHHEVTVYYTQDQQKIVGSPRVFTSVTNKWSITGYFQKGENISIDYRHHADWSLPPYEFTTLEEQYFDKVKVFVVDIINPIAHNYTEIEAYIIIDPPYHIVGEHPFLKVVHHGGIKVEDHPNDIGGIIKNDGNYTVTCSLYPSKVQDVIIEDNQTKPIIRDASPPTWLALYKKTKETIYPYIFLLPVGTSLSVIGIITSAWGVKKGIKRIITRTHGGSKHYRKN